MYYLITKIIIMALSFKNGSFVTAMNSDGATITWAVWPFGRYHFKSLRCVTLVLSLKLISVGNNTSYAEPRQGSANNNDSQINISDSVSLENSSSWSKGKLASYSSIDFHNRFNAYRFSFWQDGFLWQKSIEIHS